MSEPLAKKPIQEFKARGTGDWRPVAEPADGDEARKRAAEKNRDDLHNMLLASLQMQHLVVLAGSGCSLAAGGPSMRDLWVAAVCEEPTEAAKKVAASVHQDLEDKNIEAFLSRIESFLDIGEDGAITEFLNASRRVILDKCSEFLEAGRLEAHKTF